MSGEYPADWSKPELGDFAKATGGSRFPPAAQGSKEGAYPFYKVSDMNLPGNERFMGVANNWITEATRKKIKAKTFPAGSVIFPKIGAAVATNKKRLLTQESIIDNNLMAVVVDDPDVCAFDYLRFWFETVKLQDLSNSGALPSIPGHRVHTMHVPLPSLPEQKKIAHILSTVQRAIEAQERIIKITTELKKALMHKLFTEGLRGETQKQTEIGPVPKSWEVVRFEDGASIKNGQVDPRKAPFADMLHVGSENIECDTGRLVKLNTNRELKISSGNYYFTPEDVLYSKIRPYLNKVALPNFEGTCSADMYPLRSESHFVREYLFYYLLSDGFKKRAMSFQDRTGIPKINRAQLGSIHMACPSKEEQAQIAATLFSCDNRRDLAQRKMTNLQELFSTLLHELITAKTRVHKLQLPARGQAS